MSKRLPQREHRPADVMGTSPHERHSPTGWSLAAIGIRFPRLRAPSLTFGLPSVSAD
jgi:hypothetical protein